MKSNEIRNLNNEELQKKLNDLKDELFNLRFQLTAGQLENPVRIREVRKSIARVKTVIREKELNINC